MPILNCGARSCGNNVDGMCQAGYININGDPTTNDSDNTYCANFIETNEVASNMNYMGQLMQGFSSAYRMRMNPEISCNINSCIYNTNNQCYANNIVIQGDLGNNAYGTRCDSFSNY